MWYLPQQQTINQTGVEWVAGGRGERGNARVLGMGARKCGAQSHCTVTAGKSRNLKDLAKGANFPGMEVTGLGACGKARQPLHAHVKEAVGGKVRMGNDGQQPPLKEVIHRECDERRGEQCAILDHRNLHPRPHSMHPQGRSVRPAVRNEHASGLPRESQHARGQHT